MKKKGKFVLFEIDEFDRWLKQMQFSRAIKVIQNHHTYQPGYAHFNGNNHFTLLENMERFHMADRGFSEIAQNLTSFPDGTLAVCRSLDKVPAGIKGANQQGICIEHLGNFDKGRDPMNSEHADAIVRINALLCREFRLAPSTDSIVYHHWYDQDTGLRTNGSGKTKSCPGTAFFGGNTVEAAAEDFVPRIREALKEVGGATWMSAARPEMAAEVIAGSLNVRGGQGTSFPVVKSLKRGVRVNIYEIAGDWGRIHANQQQWVAMRFLHTVGEGRRTAADLQG